MRSLLLALAVAGCNGSLEPSPKDTVPAVDGDGDGVSPPEDCDDGDVAVFPGAVDPWYDGIDQDCAGNDDYDQDGDGHAAADHGGDDCNDQTKSASPTVAEMPYDGLDNDCDPATPDDDIDLDGFGYIEDCDDQDAAIFPGALEVLDDDDDDDCDGAVDQTPWGTGGLVFTDPARPALVQADDYVVLAVVAAQAEVPTRPEVSAYLTPGLLVSLDPEAVNGADPAVEVSSFYGAADADPITGADLEVVGNTVYLGFAYYNSVNDFGYLGVRPLTWAGVGVGWFPDPPSYWKLVLTQWLHADVHVDAAGEVWECGAAPTAVAVFHAIGSVSSPGIEAEVEASHCFWTGDDAFTSLDGFGGPTSWDSDPTLVAPPAIAADQVFAPGPWTSGHARAGVAVAMGAAGGFRTVDAGGATDRLGGYTVVDADVAYDPDGDAWIVAVVDQGSQNELLLLSEPASGASSIERTLDTRFDGRTLRPVGAAVWVTEDRVFVAVSANDMDGTGRDLVGWAAYGR